MSEEKQYYAIYTGSGDGIVIHSTWNNIESAVNDLLSKNPKAKKHAFDNKKDAKKFAKHGFDQEAIQLLLKNERLNKKVNQDIANLTSKSAIAFTTGSYLEREKKTGYGAIIFTDKGLYLPKELCGNIFSQSLRDAKIVAAKQVVKWAVAHHKSELTIYHDYEGEDFEQNFDIDQAELKLTFCQVPTRLYRNTLSARYINN